MFWRYELLFFCYVAAWHPQSAGAANHVVGVSCVEVYHVKFLPANKVCPDKHTRWMDEWR